jgi:2-alkenal reductase
MLPGVNTRFFRFVLLWALVLATLWLGERLIRGEALRQSLPTSPPQLVVPEGKLSDWERNSAEVFRAAGPSVAYITTESRRYNPLLGVGVAKGAGSGFIWDTAGHVVTNHHVVEGAGTVFVQLDVGEPIRARVVGAAPHYDIAVIRLAETPGGLRPLPLGESKNLAVGQAAYAIGNPFGLQRTLTSGIVSAVERRLPTASGREVRGVIQTDAAINPGNSGGPLVDSSARLIGVNTAIYSESGGFAGIGFAIPVDLVKRVVPQIIKNGRAPRPGIGIVAADEAIAAQLGTRGIVVLGVAEGSPAERAGIVPFDFQARAPGDVIVKVNGQPVDTLSDFVALLDEIGVGREVTLTVRRGEAERTVKLTVIDLQA